MSMFGRFVFGMLCNFFGRLHYKHEVLPYAARRGYTRTQVYEASLKAHKRMFDRAWPEETK